MKTRKIVKARAKRASSTLSNPSPWFYEALAGSTATASGVQVGPETALNLSVVWACVRVISETIGSLPWFVYKRTADGGREKAPKHEAYALLHDSPNPDMTAMGFKETTVAHALLWGNGYAEIVTDEQERAAGLFPMHPSRVEPQRSNGGRLVYRIDGGTGGEKTLQANQVLHVCGLSPDGIKGYSVIQKARESMGLTMAAERFGASFFGNGSKAGGVLKHPKALSENARKNLKQSVESMLRGDKTLGLLLLEEGMDWTQTSIPPNDAQFLETRQFQVEEICRWFRVQPHKVQHLLHATFSNIEHQSIEFVTDTIRPWLVRIEQEANRKLIRPSEQGTYYTENLVDALLRGDALSRSQALQIQMANGVLLPDEWRQIESRNALPDGLGKRPYVTQQFVPLDQVDALIEAKIAPKEAPAPAAPADDAEDSPTGAVKRHLKAIAAERGMDAAAAESRRLTKLIEANLGGA